MSRLFKASKDLARRLGKGVKTPLAAVGLVTVGALSFDAWKTSKFAREEAKEKKRVLVLNFDRLKLVNKQDGVSWLRSKSSDDALEEMGVQELIDLIHEAAQDPQCVAIFGKFGHGQNISAGMADTEEIRNALRVFRESHRVHREPNLSHEAFLERNNKEKKRLFAYADTFESDNKDYYLASIFTHIHLQEKGLFGLHGMSASVPFLKDALKRYGVKTSIYKHGMYKNAPNSLDQSGFTKHHRENVQNYLQAINFGMCSDMATARKNLPFSMDTWQLIHDSGSFTSSAAQKIGLVDYAPSRSPLSALLALRNTKDEAERERIKAKWGTKTDLDSFQADEEVSLAEYKNIVAQRRKMEQRKWHIFSRLQESSKRHSMVNGALAALGFEAPRFNLTKDDYSKPKADALKEKVALIRINGTIDGKRVRKVLPCLKKIRDDKDIKALVVRIDSPGGTITASETLYQELKALPQQVVFSFGNVSASGGYYIASCADRIFASRSTLTGSIGVYGVRFDLSDLAAQYGIKFGHISISEMALANNAFHPCTNQMHANSQRIIDKAYDDFLGIVTSGRRLPRDYVEKLAGGRVFTGEQGKMNGLVDEIGGLHRAISYARRNYTSGEAKVEVFSAEQPFLERFQKYLSNFVQEPARIQSRQSSLPNFGLPFPGLHPSKAFDVYMTVDENSAIQNLLGLNSSDSEESYESPLLSISDSWVF